MGAPAASASPTPPGRARRLGRRLVWAYVALTAIGMAAFVASARPHPWSPRLALQAPLPHDEQGRVNWASAAAGGQVRADEWDYFRSHNPMFLIDGEPQPTGTEKWASLPHVRYPWVEIALDGRHDVEEVVIRHAGWLETAAYTNERYTLRCYRGDERVAEEGTLDNREAVARHPLACPDVDRLRVDFDCTGRVDVARIYEIEAWGR